VLLEQQPDVSSVIETDGTLVVTLQDDVSEYSSLARLLIEAGHDLLLFREEEVNLEAAFMTLTQGLGARI